ncbi:TetR-like C-terminal domain-containing protein [Rhodococcus qingshengii]|uniref:TetR-like C-terminal domain-containing protein n=1 Tax=Rhodococcus qingshengii TaxID=334542 RepID=UPI002AFE045C|nr:TetR-like C-terminal domain-containing protein [Rhodococcus qingshengii]MEA1796899.1 TetR-like C-terminal domain-containing protein [Rhodococcus qingshengii]
MKQRGRAVRTAVIEATVRKVAELGPQSVTIAAIADEADVHPTSIYRRWATVDLLVVDALREFTNAGLSIPDTGTLFSDLLTFARSLQDWLATDTGLALARTGVMPTDDTEILAARAQFWRARFDAAAAMIHRGIERGEVPDGTDPDTVLAAIASPIRLAAISQNTEPRIDLDKLVALVVGVDPIVK